jgi:hypothetical protein
MSMTRERIKRIGGRCIDVAMGVFLIAVLVLIWNSSRTKADSSRGVDVVKAKKLANKTSRSNIEALVALQGTIDVCLQDDSNPAIVFLGNSATGAYSFCCGTTTFTGTALVIRRGNIVSFQHNAPDRRVLAINDGSVFKGTAAVQSPPGTIRCTIGDRDTRNNTCVCGQASGGGGQPH